MPMCSTFSKILFSNYFHLDIPTLCYTASFLVKLSEILLTINPSLGGCGGTLLSNDEQNVYTAKGISLFDSNTCQRSDFVPLLAKSLKQKKLILVQASPYSGKTSLAQLLENYLVNSSKQHRVIRVSLL